ncbi:hypothetical protein QS257_16400 [Terrilactibacillus sp. S3-3]|nr:hypothetical protein QS257_16400 [Terrilactibacillus sp. S3-3]
MAKCHLFFRQQHPFPLCSGYFFLVSKALDAIPFFFGFLLNKLAESISILIRQKRDILNLIVYIDHNRRQVMLK